MKKLKCTVESQDCNVKIVESENIKSVECKECRVESGKWILESVESRE